MAGAHSTVGPRIARVRWILLVGLLVGSVGLQIVLEEWLVRPTSLPGVAWIRSPELMRRLTFGFNTIWADVYWIRTIQFFGDTRRSTDRKKDYAPLYPLLDITTSLDPHFNIAYRLGAVLLSEGYPSGAGNPAGALALLEKGMHAMPGKWQ